MRVEVHVHGHVDLRAEATVAKLEEVLSPWLDYMDIDTIEEAKSVHEDEPGIVFDGRAHALDVCWTGDVGRNFRQRIEEALQALCPYTAQAAEIEVSYYYDDETEEFGLVFVGPTPEAIHEAQRGRMVEDVSHLLARHFDQNGIGEVVALVNHLFARSAADKSGQAEISPLEHMPAGRKHLH